MNENVKTTIKFLFLFAKSPKLYVYYVNNSTISNAIKYTETLNFINNYLSAKDLLTQAYEMIQHHKHIFIDVANQKIFEVESENVNEYTIHKEINLSNIDRLIKKSQVKKDYITDMISSFNETFRKG